MPTTIDECDLSGNKLLGELPNFTDCHKLRVLNISDTAIKSIDSVPDSVVIMDSCKCKLRIVKKLPKSLVTWKSYIAQIETIECEFPDGLKELDLYNNDLIGCPDLPASLVQVDLANNKLLSIPRFPPTAECIDLKNNQDLDVKEIEELIEKFPSVKILFNNPRRHNKSPINLPFMWTSPHDFIQTFTRRSPSPMHIMVTETSYSEENPHYIPHKKTYVI